MPERSHPDELQPDFVDLSAWDDQVEELLVRKMTELALKLGARYGVRRDDIALLSDALSELGARMSDVPDEKLSQLADAEASIEMQYLGHLDNNEDEE